MGVLSSLSVRGMLWLGGCGMCNMLMLMLFASETVVVQIGAPCVCVVCHVLPQLVPVSAALCSPSLMLLLSPPLLPSTPHHLHYPPSHSKAIQLSTERTKEVPSYGDEVWKNVGFGLGMGFQSDPGESPLRMDVTRETLPPRKEAGAKKKYPPPHGMRDFLDYFKIVALDVAMELIDVKNTVINDLYIRGAGTLQELQDMPIIDLDDLAQRQIPPQPKEAPARPGSRTLRNFLRVVVERDQTEMMSEDEVWNTGVIELAKWVNKHEFEIQELGTVRMAWLARWCLCEFPIGARIYLAAQDVRQLEVELSRDERRNTIITELRLRSGFQDEMLQELTPLALDDLARVTAKADFPLVEGLVDNVFWEAGSTVRNATRREVEGIALKPKLSNSEQYRRRRCKSDLTN